MKLFNTACQWARRVGNDAYGDESFGALVEIPASILKSSRNTNHSSPRGNLSASMAFSDDLAFDCRLMASHTLGIEIGDKVVVDGDQLKVKSVEVKRDVNGIISHVVVGANKWH